MKKILLYYKYVQIDDVQKAQKEHLAVCKSLELKGRIILAKEGINGTVSGEVDNIEKYKEFLNNSETFSGTEFKESTSDADVFKKLSIKVRDEIVSMKLEDDIDMASNKSQKGKYISPTELNKLLHSDKEFYIIDARNNYESYIGKFKDAITPDISNFRDFPKEVKKLSKLKNKMIVTYCTGGIRCEKASAYMIKSGFKNVYQLHGGIIKYGEEFPDDGYEGKCYVFDSRISVDINSPEKKKIISKCHHCHKKSDRYINCANASCNLQFVCCEDCEKKFEMACSKECISYSRYK